MDLALPRTLLGCGSPEEGVSLPRITVAVADRVQVQVVVTTVRHEGVDDMTSALLVFPVAPVSVLEIT